MAFDESDPVVTGTKYGYQNEMDKRSVYQIFHGTVTANNNSFLVTDSGDVPTGVPGRGAERRSPLATRKEVEAEGTAGMDDRRNEGRGARMASEGARREGGCAIELCIRSLLWYTWDKE